MQRQPSGGSFADISGTEAHNYARTLNAGEETATTSIVFSVTSGDSFRVVARRVTGTSTITTLTNGCRFNIVSIGQGATGPTGPTGPTGSITGGGFFPIEGERSGGASANSYFAIGNGAQPTNGVYIPEQLTLRYLALSADSVQTSATMSLYVNGSNSGQSVSLSNQAQNVSSQLNYTIPANSRITFRMTSGSTNATTVATGWFANIGAVGPTGPTGPAGSDGSDGSDGATGPTGPAGDNVYSGINAQTGTTYTAVSSDEGKLITLNNAGTITFTIPPNSSVAYTVGVRLDIAQFGGGQVTVAGGSGVTVNSTPTSKLRTQYSAASCIKIATDEWLLVGDLAES